VTAEFAVNNKIYSVNKVSLFIANYNREMRIGADIRKKNKSRKGNGIFRKYKDSTRRS